MTFFEYDQPHNLTGSPINRDKRPAVVHNPTKFYENCLKTFCGTPVHEPTNKQTSDQRRSHYLLGRGYNLLILSLVAKVTAGFYTICLHHVVLVYFCSGGKLKILQFLAAILGHYIVKTVLL